MPSPSGPHSPAGLHPSLSCSSSTVRIARGGDSTFQSSQVASPTLLRALSLSKPDRIIRSFDGLCPHLVTEYQADPTRSPQFLKTRFSGPISEHFPDVSPKLCEIQSRLLLALQTSRLTTLITISRHSSFSLIAPHYHLSDSSPQESLQGRCPPALVGALSH